jgi:iron complex outermembrane receptor protein
MDFRNEIAPIGAISLTGSALRKNVDASYRRGIEADAAYRGIPRLLLSANASASINRIRSYTDSSGLAPVTYHDVEPLLTPSFTTFERAQVAVTRNVSFALETRYTSRAFLQNDGDERYVLPAAFNLDGSVFFHVRDHEILLRGNNLTDSKKYGSGYVSDGVSYYFVVPPRNFFVGVKLGF